jgi:hypothetical protein
MKKASRGFFSKPLSLCLQNQKMAEITEISTNDEKKQAVGF